MSLSNIRIPIQWCNPMTQHSNKNSKRIRRQRCNLFKRTKLLLLSIVTLGSINKAYAIPGTNYVLVHGRSNDNHRQERMTTNVVNQASQTKQTARHSKERCGPYNEPKRNDATITLNCEPHCFIADTDSRSYVIDTGANRIIIRDSRLFEDFKTSKATVKGINGKQVLGLGTGTVRLSLRSDKGKLITIKMYDAVYVPTSPYNLLPPQLLVRKFRQNGYDTRYAKHDDEIYQFFYQKTGSEMNVLTVHINNNDLFIFRSNEGYTSFFKEAVTLNSDWCLFAGSSHVIPNDDEDTNQISQSNATIPAENPRETTNGQSSEQTREPPQIIPCDDTDFSVAKEPADVDFQVEKNQELKYDPYVAMIRQKQARLATIHERLGHISFGRLKLMARAGLISRDLASVDPPTCPGCAYGKAHRKPWRSKGIQNLRKIKPATASGQVVSVDQLVSPTPGLVPTHRGIPTTKRYIGATVFVDHFSDFTYVHLMTEMNAESTVKAKQEFERTMATHGVNVRHYHCDNGLFDTKAFKANIQVAGQTISFCGVNAHHQNGKAEARIKDVTTGARTSLQHAAHRWPKAINASLWPAALKHYTNLRNSLPTKFTAGEKDKNDRRRKSPDLYQDSPISILTGTDVEPNIEHFHPFGSPVYVLQNALQARNPFNKWEDRSRVGIFLCHSPLHAANVSLILNTQSGNVSPQYHCVYDDGFDTCKRDAKFESVWQYKAKLQERGLVNTTKRFDQQISTPHSNSVEKENYVRLEHTHEAPQLITPWEHTSNEQSAGEAVNETPSLQEEQQSQPNADSIQEETITTTRAGRVIRPPKFHEDYMAHIAYMDTYSPQPNISDGLQLLQPDIAAHEEPHPLALMMEQVVALVSKSDPDTMYLEEAMNQPDREEFIKAMHKELADHINRGHWKVVPIKFVPSNKVPLPMVWSMKRKRNPVGEIIKWKARLCAGGHKSLEFIDYWSTYSPVVSWSTVRLMIVMALINQWHMQSIDFVLAFPQAPVKTDIFMKPPKVPYDFEIQDLPKPTDRLTKVYKLIKNLYGLKDASKTWFEYLQKGLVKRGWRQSEIDTCLFTKEGIILVVYVDDAILISPYKSLIDKEIKSLQQAYDLTDDGELKDYLGTRFIRRPNNTIELSQPKMIERVLKIVGLDPDNDQTTRHDSPADSNKILDDDPNGQPRRQSWNYRSAVGCLSYLQAMIRPDITFAVQQCARFCNNPQRQHEEAVKRICRYLLNTKDKGIIMKPDPSRGLECYCDADWAGSWKDRSSHDPLSSHSRSGYMILYAGCPIIWSSKRQQLIALSTTEAEYIALSSALREVIAVLHLLEEIQTRGFKLYNPTAKITCRTFEDNKSCIEIATNHKTRARTKHLSVRLHHFRSHVINKTITIEHVSTQNQLADIYTKPLPRQQFQFLRDKIMSWNFSPSLSSKKRYPLIARE